MAEDKDHDWYKIIGVEITATIKEINKAYKKKALELHPDKNRDNPDIEAVNRKFQLLQKAHTVLNDEKQREEYDKKIKGKLEQAKRDAAMDQKRRQMKQSLEEREKAHKQKVNDEETNKKKLYAEMDRLRTEGRKKQQDKPKSSSTSSGPSFYAFSATSMADADNAVKVKWSRKKRDYNEEDIRIIMRAFGQINHFKMGKNKATVVFATPEAMESAMTTPCGDPQARLSIKRLKPQQPPSQSTFHQGPGAEPTSTATPSPFAFPAFAAQSNDIDHDEFEAQVLARMMQAAASQKGNDTNEDMHQDKRAKVFV